MTETAELAALLRMRSATVGDPRDRSVLEGAASKCDRLATLECAVIVREDVEAMGEVVPPEACWWSRDIKGNGEVECVWLDEELDEVPVDGIAPNYPVNGALATPARLPIISLREGE